jgi:A/G-specific adenine glycosylase
MTFSADVLTWYEASARDLPWRRPEASAWAVLVSEFMLQQTPVARVLPVYTEWLARWPTPPDLAAVAPGEAVRAWGRLGYPRRALRLHAAATAIAKTHGGVVPADVDTLLALPGVGEYTARAVAAFAFGQRVPVVDTNVRRVVARVELGQADPGPPSTRRDLAATAALLPDGAAVAARFSVALMELGALVCTARTPQCSACPVTQHCTWLRAGQPPHTGPVRRAQRFEGTDRQVRGRLMALVRAADSPVPRAELDLAWADVAQRERALHSLVVDGLLEPVADERFALPS